MQPGCNRRGHWYHKCDKRHLKLNDLKEAARGLKNKYLIKEDIPSYPQPEFHVRQLRHDTDEDGLRGIGKDCGFKNPGKKNLGQENPSEGSLLWWSLVVGPDEIASAEKTLLETTFPDRTEDQALGQQSFLEKFATSPAFKKTARLGSYRFTFPLEELLQAYSQQFCSGSEPVMRVLRTILYRQEVAYVVLVHSPASQEDFSRFPLLTDDPNAVCTYRDFCFTWRAQAMCETHRYELVLRPAEQQMEAHPVWFNPQFYVWDNVAVALHVEDQFCSGSEPVMRVLRTILYRQEVAYVVLVHSPASQEDFSRFPLLTDDPNAVCTYRDFCFTWRAQAMCETHRYELVLRPAEQQMEAHPVWFNPQFYVWDNVAVALHVEDQVLKFESSRLRQNLKFCRAERPGLIKGVTFQDLPEAEAAVQGLWPDEASPLEEDQ